MSSFPSTLLVSWHAAPLGQFAHLQPRHLSLRGQNGVGAIVHTIGSEFGAGVGSFSSLLVGDLVGLCVGAFVGERVTGHDLQLSGFCLNFLNALASPMHLQLLLESS